MAKQEPGFCLKILDFLAMADNYLVTVESLSLL